MKLRSVVTITTLLLLSIIGAGAASGYAGYKMGTLALKGVSQPEDNPTRKLARQKGYRKPQPFEPIKEQTILVRVYNQKYQYNKQTKAGKGTAKAEDKSKETQKPQEKAVLPLKSTVKNVTLTVSQVKHEGGDILLDISLTNQGDSAVKFLYSFLEVTDNEGDALGVIVEDLPETIPATGKEIGGIVRIPTTLAEESTTLSLSLTDYPDQARTLEIKDIPIEIKEPILETTDSEDSSANPE